jgi:hypothetical protein
MTPDQIQAWTAFLKEFGVLIGIIAGVASPVVAVLWSQLKIRRDILNNTNVTVQTSNETQKVVSNAADKVDSAARGQESAKSDIAEQAAVKAVAGATVIAKRLAIETAVATKQAAESLAIKTAEHATQLADSVKILATAIKGEDGTCVTGRLEKVETEVRSLKDSIQNIDQKLEKVLAKLD